MKILKTKELPLLKRKRVTAEIEHFKKATPKKDEVIKTLAKELKSTEENISLLHVYPHFGREKAKIIANIYENKESKDLFEKINKNPLKQKKKSGEAPTQETPTAKETPKEEETPKKEVKEDGKKASKK
jgi:ribosomal protein S24E